MSKLTERILFLKFVGVLKFVKISEFSEFLKFIKFEFSIYRCGCGVHVFVSSVNGISVVVTEVGGMIDDRKTTWCDHFDFLQVSYTRYTWWSP